MIRYLGRNGAARASRTLSARASMRGTTPATSLTSVQHLAQRCWAVSVVLALTLMAVFMPAAGYSATCTTTVSSTSAASTAVTSAASGSVVCLADGSYGSLSVSAPKTAPGVTVQAQNPGKATITSATVGGSYITLAQFKVQGGPVDVQPGSPG